MPWIFSESGEYPLAENMPPKNVMESCWIEAFAAVENESFFLGYGEQVYDVGIMVSVVLPIDEHIMSCMANTPGHWATMSSILI